MRDNKRNCTYGLGARILSYIMFVICGVWGVALIITGTTPFMIVLGIINTIIALGNLYIAIKFAINVRRKY